MDWLRYGSYVSPVTGATAVLFCELRWRKRNNLLDKYPLCWFIDLLADSLTDVMTGWLTNWLVDWLIDWLIEWRMSEWLVSTLDTYDYYMPENSSTAPVTVGWFDLYIQSHDKSCKELYRISPYIIISTLMQCKLYPRRHLDLCNLTFWTRNYFFFSFSKPCI